MNSKSVDWSALAWILIICIVASIVYSPSLRFFFSQDDFVFLARAARVASFQDFVRLFTADDHFYRPVSRVSLFVMQWHLFGPNAAAFHLVSLGIHTFNAVLLFLLCRRLFAVTLLAGLAGLVYATHLVPFLAVYWVSGIQDLSMTTFLLLSLHFYIRHLEVQGNLWLALSMLTYGLALLSKETAVTLPLLLIFAAFVQGGLTGRRPDLRGLAWQMLAYGIVLGLYLLVRSQKASLFLPREGPYAWTFAPGPMLQNLYAYLGDTLYVRDWQIAAPLWAGMVCALFVIVLVLTSWRSRRYRWAIAFGIGWFVISLFPVLFLSQRTYSFYAYYALAGMAVTAATPVTAVLERIRSLIESTGPIHRPAMGVGVSLLLVAWLWFSTAQVRAMEAKDPAGIISKSILAREAITGLQALYPSLPQASTLYVVGLTERDVWAVGHGDLFRVYYPQVETVLVREGEDSETATIDTSGGYVYHFDGGE